MTLTMAKPLGSENQDEHSLPAPSHVDDDIFYSDDESSDSENYWSKYFNNKKESIFSGSLRPDSNGTNSPENNLSFGKNSNYIESPITQICSGIENLLGESVQSSLSPPSYSSIIKKEPLGVNTSSQNFLTNKVAYPKKTTLIANSKKPAGKVKESALAAGYRFKAREPIADPRYPGDQQLMVGPIPGQLEHDVIYHNLRSIFQARGPVCFMFIHKSAVKDLNTGKPVKFGYVVFAEKGIAQKLLKEGGIEFGEGEKISVRPMKIESN